MLKKSRPVFQKKALTLICGCLAAAFPLAAEMPEPQAPPPPPPPPAATAPGYVFAMPGGSYLGVGVREIDDERARTLKLKETHGVEITRVDEESPAAKAGLKSGDVVLEYNGTRVEGAEQFVRLVKETPANRGVKLTVFRGGSTQSIAATIGIRKGPKTMAWSSMPEMNSDKFKVIVPPMEMTMPDVPKAMMAWRSTMLGVEGEALGDSQLAEYFGVKEGVLVRSVMKGTSAEKAGIKAGDVLLKIDDTTLTAPRDITSSIRSARSESKKTLNIVLMREKREMSIPVTLEDEPEKFPGRGQRVTMQRF